MAQPSALCRTRPLSIHTSHPGRVSQQPASSVTWEGPAGPGCSGALNSCRLYNQIRAQNLLPRGGAGGGVRSVGPARAQAELHRARSCRRTPARGRGGDEPAGTPCGAGPGWLRGTSPRAHLCAQLSLRECPPGAMSRADALRFTDEDAACKGLITRASTQRTGPGHARSPSSRAAFSVSATSRRHPRRWAQSGCSLLLLHKLHLK